jgi:hypothetical protein
MNLTAGALIIASFLASFAADARETQKMAALSRLYIDKGACPGEGCFFVDDCNQNSKLLWIFESLSLKDLACVVIHHTDSAGLPLSPPLFFGLFRE